MAGLLRDYHESLTAVSRGKQCEHCASGEEMQPRASPENWREKGFDLAVEVEEEKWHVRADSSWMTRRLAIQLEGEEAPRLIENE